MASGNDLRVGLAKESTYGTRVTPTRFLPLNSIDLGYTYNRYFSPALGMGRWTRPSIITTSVGAGSITGDVPTTGFGYLLDGLHGNAVTPVQQGATPAYLQTHTLDSAPSKSYTVQQQTPPVTSGTLVPLDFLGVVFGGLTLSWEPAGVLSYELPTVVRALDTAQTLATYTAPTGWDVLSFKGGSLSIGGVAEANIVGGGNLSIGYSLRDDAFALGSTGLIAKPVETDKPSAEGSFTADFNDLTNLNRVVNNTVGDVVLKFEGATISGANKYYLEATIPDCVFTSPAPTVSGPGPVQQKVSFSHASTTGDPVVIKYQSTDITI